MSPYLAGSHLSATVCHRFEHGKLESFAGNLEWPSKRCGDDLSTWSDDFDVDGTRLNDVLESVGLTGARLRRQRCGRRSRN